MKGATLRIQVEFKFKQVVQNNAQFEMITKGIPQVGLKVNHTTDMPLIN